MRWWVTTGRRGTVQERLRRRRDVPGHARRTAAGPSLRVLAVRGLRMSEMPETRFTRTGEVDVAYQVVGREGGLDLVFVPGWVSHLEVMWELPEFAQFLDRLAGMGRLILFDKRGTGLSDRVAGMPTLEQRADDIAAVMDAAGSARAAILAWGEGAAIAANSVCAIFVFKFRQATKFVQYLNGGLKSDAQVSFRDVPLRGDAATNTAQHCF